MNNCCNRSFPFGRDVDTLVICANEDHRISTIREWGIKARYETIETQHPGLRFRKIYVCSHPDIRMPKLGRVIDESLRPMLTEGGEIQVL